MRSTPTTFLRICMLLGCFAASAALYAQGLPQRLTFLQSSGLSLTIEQPSYSPANQSPSGPLSGSGTYTISVGGKAVFQGAGFAFAGILADSNGQVQTNAAGYAIPKDIVWKNLVGSGVDLTIPAQSKIVVSKTATVNITITGSATALLPFRGESGERSQVSIANLNLGGTSAGSITLEADIALKNGPKLEIGGVGVSMVTPHISVASPAPAGSDGHIFHFSSQLATVYAHLPGLLTTDPFELVATGLTIDETGTPSCSKLSLGQATAGTEAAELAPLPIIGLAAPVNFGIRPTNVTVSLSKGALNFSSATFDLLLPEMLTDAAGAPAVIPGIQYSAANHTFKLPAIPNGGFKFQWKPGTLGSVNLSLTGLTFDPTVGLSHITGSVTIGAGGGPLSSGSGTPLTLTLQDFSVNANGPTGTVGLAAGNTDATVWNLPVSLHSGSVTFDEGEVVGADLAATMKGDFSIGLEIGISKTGCAVTVKTGAVNSPTFGGMQLSLTGGSVVVDGKGGATVLVSGSATVPAPPPLPSSITLDFTNLGIVNGTVVAGSLKLATPVKLDFGPVTLTLTEMSYQPNPEEFLITGDVSVPDVLGAGADVSFEGLKITAGKPLKVTVGGIGIDCKIPGLGTISAAVNMAAKDLNGFTSPLEGSASVSIEGLPAFGATFLLSKNGAWVLALAFDFPQEMLPSLALAPPYGSPSPPFLYLLGVHGAIGHGAAVQPAAVLSNVDQKDPDFVARTLERYRYDSEHPDNWLIQLGLDVGTIDEYLLWGPLTLSVAIPAVDIDIQGELYLLADRLSSASIPRVGDSSRTANFDLNYKAPDTFTAQGQINIQLGVAPLLYKAFGTLQAEFSPARGFLYAGWPVETNGFGSEFMGVGSKAGFGIDLWPAQNGVQSALHAGMMQYADFFGIVKGERGIDFGMSLPKGSPKASVYFDVYVEGQVDFGVISAYARAQGGAAWTVGQLPDITGQFTAGIHTPLGDVDVDTGTVHLLGS